jgi:L-fuconolactonase
VRVDAHHHVWDLAVRDQPWITGPAMAPIRCSFDLADLAGPAAAAGIEATVLVQTVAEAAETPELLAQAEAHPLVGAVVGWTDLSAPSVADDLAALAGGPGGHWLRGIRHQVQGEPDPGWLSRPRVRRGLAAVGAAGLVYELLVLPRQLPAAMETAAALPQVRFVLDHCAKPPIVSGRLEPWATGIRRLAALDNVWCKLSGLVTEADHATWLPADLAPYVEVVLDAFGPYRLAFGSDWPVCLLAAGYAEVVATADRLTAGLAAAEYAAVFGGTAAGVYRLQTI